MVDGRIFVSLAAALLNLSLAVLLVRVRQRRPANLVLASLFGLNGAVALAGAAVPMGLPVDPAGWSTGVEYLLNLLGFVPLVALPLLVPARGRSPALVAGAVAATALVVAFVWGAAAVKVLGPPGAVPAGVELVADVLAWALLLGVPSLGAALLLDSFLASRSPIDRDQARFVLAAYVAKLALSATTYRGPFALPPGPSPAAVAEYAFATTLLVVVVAVPLALVASAVRRGRAGDGYRLPDGSGVPLFALAAGAALSFVPGGFAFEFLVMRPVLLAYGMLQYQLLELDAQRNRAPVAVAILGAMAAVFAIVASEAQRVGLPAMESMGLALVATLALGAALAAPLVRAMLAPLDVNAESRRLLAYRAALEASRREGRADPLASLRGLRRELDVSDREHALLVAELDTAEARDALRPGSLFLGRYRIAREVGRGGSGVVLLARDEKLGREVALKRLLGDERRNAEAVARFQKEARLASALAHPNVVAVHDVETVGDDAYIVMEYVPGGSVRDVLDREGPLPDARALQITRDILSALDALHARGIVHRDVKPSNVLLAADGRAKLSDFTLARDIVSGETVRLGATEAPAGTLAFMAPEQSRGRPATPRSDLYAAGATLYCMLSGRPPIPVEGLDEFEARLRLVQAAPDLPLPGASPRLNAALARALAKQPADRFASAGEMAAALGV